MAETNPFQRPSSWRLQVVSTCLLAFFCLFSFGTAKLRARIHQERRQALVTADSGDQLTPVAALQAPALPATAAVTLLPAHLPQAGRLPPQASPRPLLPQLAAARPWRGPPAAA